MPDRRIGQRTTRSSRSQRSGRSQETRSRSPTPRALLHNSGQQQDPHAASQQPGRSSAPDEFQPGSRQNEQQRLEEARNSTQDRQPASNRRLRASGERPTLPVPPSSSRQRSDRPTQTPRGPLNAVAELGRIHEALEAQDPAIFEHPPSPSLWAWAAQIMQHVSRNERPPSNDVALARMLLGARERLQTFSHQLGRQSPPEQSQQPTTYASRTRLPANLAAILHEPATDREPAGLRHTLAALQEGLMARDESVLNNIPEPDVRFWARDVLNGGQRLTRGAPQLQSLARATLMTLEQLFAFAEQVERANDARVEPSHAQADLARVKAAIEQGNPRLIKDNPPEKMWKWTLDILRRERANERVSPRLMNLAYEFFHAYRELKEMEKLHDARDLLRAHFAAHSSFSAASKPETPGEISPAYIISEFVGSNVLPSELGNHILLETRRRASKLLTLIGYAEQAPEALELFHLAADNMRAFCANQPNSDALRGALTEFRAMWEVTFGDEMTFDPPELPPTKSS